MAASLLRLGRSCPLQALRETLALRGTVVSANLTTKSTKPTNTKKKKDGGVGVASDHRASNRSVPALASQASVTSPGDPAIPRTEAGPFGETGRQLPQPLPAPRAAKNASVAPSPAGRAADPGAKADETTSSSDSSSESDSEKARGTGVKPRGLAKPQQVRRDSVKELPRRQRGEAGLAGGPGVPGKGAAPGQRNAQPNATLSQRGKGGEASVREELVNSTESRQERAAARPDRAAARPEIATARPPTRSTTASVPPTALPRQALPTPATSTAMSTPAAPVAMPRPAAHTLAPPTSESVQQDRAEEPPEQQQQQQQQEEEEVSGAQAQAAEKVVECVATAASAETQENQAEPEMPPEATQEELDTSTYKNTQHHQYSTMTFLDVEAEMSKYRLPQPSSGRLTPRH